MDIRQITSTYCVSPQISPEDLPALAQAGFTCIINNRPDVEIPPSHHSKVMEEAARALGLDFVELPLTHQTMTTENVTRHAECVAAGGGKVLAYCASGTRSTVVWALGEAQSGQRDVDAIIAAARTCGYDLENLRPTFEAIRATGAEG